MKKYIGTKQVEAEPMTLGEFIKKTGRNPYENDGKMHGCNEEGYLVRYKDGYESWSPKDVFDESYHEGDMGQVSDGYHTFNELYRYRLLYNAAFFNEIAKNGNIRVCKSHNHSDGKECFGGGWFIVMAELPTGQVSNHYENKYWNLFDVPELENAWEWDGHTPNEAADRIENFLKCKEALLVEPFKGFNFGEVINILKQGGAIRRSGWNGKGLFVIKQVPAHIESDIIPKMQSLPQSAKDLILKGKGFIDYTSQCLIYNENTGRADSWVPSISDVFAEDWEIVSIEDK